MALTDGDGEVMAEYAYGAYGELLGGDAALTRFLYNGRCGVSTDDNGLYYMRQRYYNTEIKRFVNQDILTGSAAGSQSLNRYSYVQGNPVSYTDPFGLSPISGLFSGSNVRHALLGLASCIPVIGFVASAADAWFYYREGNTAMAAACTVDAVIGLFGVTGSLLQMASKTRRVGKAIQIAAKIGNGGIGLYRNATTFGKSAVDFYMRHEGTFFTKDFRWELADAGDFLSMAVSGLGATTSAAGMASGISDAAKTYRQWQETDALKNSIRQNAMGVQLGNAGAGNDNFSEAIHPGKNFAESQEISQESIIRALRQSNTKEGAAVAKMIKKGSIKLNIQDSHPKGYAGLKPHGNNEIFIYKNVMNTPLTAAGYTAHEAKHFLQHLTSGTYGKIHEFEAYTFQMHVDKFFPLRTSEEIWNFVNSHPAYKNLR